MTVFNRWNPINKKRFANQRGWWLENMGECWNPKLPSGKKKPVEKCTGTIQIPAVQGSTALF